MRVAGGIGLEITAGELRKACIHIMQGREENSDTFHVLGRGCMVWLLDWDLTVTSSPGGGVVTDFSAVFLERFFRKWKRFDGLCYQFAGLPPTKSPTSWMRNPHHLMR